MTDPREIPLTQGKVAIVDADMYEELAQHKWYYLGGYAVRRRPKGVAGSSYIRMHRVVNQTPDGLYTDHIDRNTLNNTRANLRAATKSQNAFNYKRARGRSKFRGVSWHKARRRWQAVIRESGAQTYLGLFDHEEEAALAYDVAALQAQGEFARLNFPKSLTRKGGESP